MSEPVAPEAVPTATVPPRPAPQSERGAWGGLAALGALVLAKGKGLLLLLKALPAGKLLVTSLSMFAMVAVEAMRGGWLFGVGFVLLILIHELGHGWAMRQAGMATGWPVFIPFVGAMISMKGPPPSRGVEADIAYGGPLWGTAASLAVAAAGLALHSRFLFALAHTGFFLNLFNLTPLSPLDGGRIAQAFSKHAWKIGVLLLGAGFLATGSPQLLLIGVMALPRLLSGGDEAELRHDLTPEAQRGWAVRYFGLALFLVAGLHFSGQLMHGAA